MAQSVTIQLAPDLVSELEPVAAETNESLEEIVSAAVVEYLRLREMRQLRDHIAQQYDELASMWNELSEDIADDKWLAVENEALTRLEASLDD